MPYSFKVGDTNPATISQLLESFWIFVKFNINEQGHITINGGHFAIYFSQSSDAPKIGKLEFKDRETYEISDGIQSFLLKKANLEKSLKYQFSNEIAQLHLFTFDTRQSSPQEWFNDASYKPPFRIPDKNNDRSAFIKQKLDFGDFTNRHVYSISTEQSSSGTEKLLITLPFLNTSILKQVLIKGALNVAGEAFPSITCVDAMNGQENKWDYFQTRDIPLNPQGVSGFVMVTQGAFKSMSFSLNLDHWLDYTDTESLTKPLVELAHQATPMIRSIENVDINNKNSVYASSPDGPVEILYLNNLDSKERLL